MPQNGRSQCLDIVRLDEVAALKRGMRLRRVQQMQRAARAYAQGQGRQMTRGADQIEDISLDALIHVDVAHSGLHGLDFRKLHDGRDAVYRAHVQLAVENALFGIAVGITDGDARGKAVQLRFGQRIGTGKLDIVLRGDDKKRIGQRVGQAVDGHLPLLHALQQRGLCLRRGAVDLVGQDDVGENRAGTYLEVPGLLVIDGGAGNIRRQKVRRELDSLETQSQRVSQGFGQRRLADARNILDEQMPIGEQNRERQLDDLLLSHDRGFDRIEDTLSLLRQLWDFHTALFLLLLWTSPALSVRYRAARRDLSNILTQKSRKRMIRMRKSVRVAFCIPLRIRPCSLRPDKSSPPKAR